MIKMIEVIKEVMKEKGYKFFENGNFNLNQIYIRMSNKFDNFYSDLCLQIFKNELGIWQIHIFPCSTKAGNYFVKNPITHRGVKGTAVIVPNQYLGTWEFIDNNTNFHKSACLWQRKPIKVYRDGDLDNEVDYDIVQEGDEFGINQHWAGGSTVDTNSAGCLVVPIPYYWTWTENIRKSVKLYGKMVSSTILEMKDFN